ncbi:MULTISPECIES: thiamine phosphate synthase [unclassified Ensifer]|uniref:thiamine phosphate synthase n=1 Tax=unclassified Ensifer TaxID=2633371 RepID=UPI000710E0C8|nr:MULTISPECIES: thiamine phosphate synthase [unclassified Ensifer]KQW39440.1 thiamine-phosphate pyrophosphorylase [Ensifer sp. Root1252]KRC54232.1 thiamine-phosphate pyrophosphorylase [Ensifer sp. Root231]KRD01567.1 thiamine-phosphate pyrophosphorylase [Ensifer sp. Root258]
MPKVDYRLNALVDARLGDKASLADLARIAALNGATLIQYRDKTSSTREMIEQARAICAALAGTGVPFVVNDRVDLAIAAGAAGVHLGRDDMDATTVRSIMGGTAIIGLTVKNEADAQVAIASPINYACIGGVYETLSKHNPDPPVGPEGFARLRAALLAAKPDLPVGAIVSITAQRAAEVVAAGADGVAVISTIFAAVDPAAATYELRACVEKALAEASR